MDNSGLAPKVIGIERHRLQTDGEGVSTLVAFHGCPLRCRYCLNPQSRDKGRRWKRYDCNALYDEVKVDTLYFLATGGGVTFGGGEPCLQSEFIRQFRKVCGKDWLLSLETSLNVEREHVEQLLPVVDRFIVDIKDMNPAIYKRYTGRNNEAVVCNLRLLVERGRANDMLVRVPLIPGYNTDNDRVESCRELEMMGIKHFDLFT
ncbi:radical SAM protein [Butyricimonas sp. Marseille-P3923]|uniref:radical SAM protein n=1 Tax=Butyricimonas sp. Marseille-P3923 TaxID=1987504 RepID=UPI000C088B77|nr:radical SAM protein [Butyricimonas sp. Marseille-P3923]